MYDPFYIGTFSKTYQSLKKSFKTIVFVLFVTNNARKSSELCFIIIFDILFLIGVSLPDIEKVLDQRSLKVRRRPGNAKPDKLPSINGHPVTIATGHAPQQSNPSAVSTCNSILKSFDYHLLGEKELQDLCKRPAVVETAKLEAIVRPIMVNVRTSGDKALVALTEKFDKAKLSCPVIDMTATGEPHLDQEIKDAIDLAYDNIYKFHKAQLNLEPLVVETCKGVVCSRHVRPIAKVSDCYHISL